MRRIIPIPFEFFRCPGQKASQFPKVTGGGSEKSPWHRYITAWFAFFWFSSAIFLSGVGAVGWGTNGFSATPSSNVERESRPSSFPPGSISGIFPTLAMFNDEGECGTGAVVSWAGRLWAITYGPHLPFGSSDKLYEIAPDLTRTIRPESVGGTPAGRMIHPESNQLFIGPYVIDSKRNIRVLSPKLLPGRITGYARHLTDPARKIYLASMEEGFYEIDVDSLDAVWLWPDTNIRGHEKDYSDAPKNFQLGAGEDILPGYHGKGFYSGQGRLVYANNGEQSPEALVNPAIPSGALGQWKGIDGGKDQDVRWEVVRRNQFCEVTGPGGIWGNPNPSTDPIWATGWDRRSLILMVLDGGKWQSYRLPKGSRAYDGAHGWNTEWPRIRSVDRADKKTENGEKEGGASPLLMTMHGMFWDFPKTFSGSNTRGIRPKSAYLKVIGDFCRWDDFAGGDYLVIGGDDTAQSEFLNKRRYKGNLIGPGQSQSNLWFVRPEKLDRLGPPVVWGSLWEGDSVRAETPSEPFLLAGWTRRSLFLSADGGKGASITLEIDKNGDGRWEKWRTVVLGENGSRWVALTDEKNPEAALGEWIRLTADRNLENATAVFHYRSDDWRTSEADSVFDGLARPEETRFSGGIIRARGKGLGTLHFAADFYDKENSDKKESGYYEIDADLNFVRTEDPAALDFLRKNASIPEGVLDVDSDRVLILDEAGRRFRLPVSGVWADESKRDFLATLPPTRCDREIATERDLFSAAGTFYELPAENAGGFAGIRPISTHCRLITDFASWRGLLVLTGVAASATKSAAEEGKNPNIRVSDDGKMGVWVGVADDLWLLGKPTGRIRAWNRETVKKGEVSDPCLATGFDRKTLVLTDHSTEKDASTRFVKLEADFIGTGRFAPFRTFEIPAGETVRFDFPKEFGACWLRVISESDAVLTAEFVYE